MYKQYFFIFHLYIHIALIYIIVLFIIKYDLEVNFNSWVFQRIQRFAFDQHSRRYRTFPKPLSSSPGIEHIGYKKTYVFVSGEELIWK